MRRSILIIALAAAGCTGTGKSAQAPIALGDIELAGTIDVVSARIAAGATLGTLLRAGRVADSDAVQLLERAQAVFDVRKLRTRQPYRIEQWASGVLKRFEYEIDDDRFLRVSRPNGDAALVAEVLPIPKTSTEEVVRGSITREIPSLFGAMDSAGETADLALALADILSGQIDFNNDVQPLDRFSVLVEKKVREDDRAFAGYGPILAAEFRNDGRRLIAVRFTPEGADGRSPSYFDERGVSVRRFLLRSPLKFQPTVTSRFSRSRLHPVLGEARAHLGVDYRAPVGAPVIAVADGMVLEAGAAGASGRIVRLRHANGFETEYLHLSAIDVRAGTRVQQGDQIGRVGATGLVTGPHLDYRVKKNGVFVNPLTAVRDTPSAAPVPADQMEAFAAVRDRALAALGGTAPTLPSSSSVASRAPS
ncbi:MAG: peptidoglycan DD-metalloendopeptidase family protein [Vicinamibacterales bacterium]